MNTVITVVLVVGIVCVLYYIAQRHPMRRDFTANKTHSLSVKTLKILGGLNKQVEVVGLLEKGSPAEVQLKDLMQEYERRSKYISFRLVDPQMKPAEAKRYDATQYGLVVIGGNSRKVLGLEDLFKFNYENPYAPPDQQPAPEFIGEQAVTNAIISVTAGRTKTICFVQGHGERNIDGMAEADYGEVARIIRGENYNVKPIVTASETSVSKECSVVAVVGPTKPVSQAEYDQLKAYLDAGGRLLLAFDPLKNTGLESLPSEWGVRVGNDIVIDTGSNFNGEPISPVPEIMYHDITKDLIDSKLAVSLPLARSVSEDPAKRQPGVFVASLLRTSPNSWAETDLKTETPKMDGADVKGPVSLAVVATRGGGTLGAESRLVVIGDADFASNVMTGGIAKLLAGAAGNADLFVNSINWLAGEEKLISIRPAPNDARPLNITGPQKILLFTIFTFVVPVLIVMLGGVIWWKRRSL